MSNKKVPVKILVVDDDAIISMVFQYFLASSGKDFVIVNDGEEAIDKVKHEGYNFVFADLNMPGMDGYEVLRQIRLHSKETLKKIKIYAVTASPAREVAQKCQEAGFDGVLIKGFNKEKLLSLIAEGEKEF